MSLGNTSLLSTVEQDGAAGFIAVSGSDVALDRSSVPSSNRGTGPAGSVRVEADHLTLTSASHVAADAQQGPPAGAPADPVDAAGELAVELVTDPPRYLARLLRHHASTNHVDRLDVRLQ